MSTLQKETYPYFLLNIYPAPGRDAIWAHKNGDLTLATFNGTRMNLDRFPVSGTEIGTSFKIYQKEEQSAVLLSENRGLSWIDIATKKNRMPFCATITEYSGDNHSKWVTSLDSNVALIPMIHDISGDPNAMPNDSDYRTEILRLIVPPKEKIPEDTDEGVGFEDVDHQIFDAGSGAYTFLGPKQILIRQPRLDAGPKMQNTTERWISVDFNLKPATHPLLDTLNHYRDSLPAVRYMELAKQAPFALMAHDLPTPRGQLFIASWKKQMRVEPVLFNGGFMNGIEKLLLSPDEKHFLAGTEDKWLYLGTITEKEEGFSATLKQVNRFEGSYLLSWMGSSRGYVAGVWNQDETDLLIWWL